MKYELIVRSRAKSLQSIEEKHSRFFSALAQVPAPWGIEGAVIPALPDPGANLGAGVTISKLLGKGVKGRAYYVFRREFEDLGMHDDFFDMSFNPENVEYKQLVRNALPKLIVAFDAYFASVGDIEFGHIDFDAERKAGMGDTRFGVYRIYPVSFFDRTLCKRAFQLAPEDIIGRLEGKVERVELLSDGVYIVGSSEPLTVEAADKLCGDMKTLLTE